MKNNNSEIFQIEKMIEILENEESKWFQKFFISLIILVIFFYFLFVSFSVPEEQILDNIYSWSLFFSILISLIIITMYLYYYYDNRIYNFIWNFNLYKMFKEDEKEIFKTMLEAVYLNYDYNKNYLDFNISDNINIWLLKEKYINLYNYIKKNYKEKKVILMKKNKNNNDSIFIKNLLDDIYKKYFENILKKYDSQIGSQTLNELKKQLQEYKNLNSIFVVDKIKITENKLHFLQK